MKTIGTMMNRVALCTVFVLMTALGVCCEDYDPDAEPQYVDACQVRGGLGPCKRGAFVIHPRTGNAVCDCRGTGMTGDKCEEIDYSSPPQLAPPQYIKNCQGRGGLGPCKRGTCVSHPRTAVCDCRGTGYTGDECEVVQSCKERGWPYQRGAYCYDVLYDASWKQQGLIYNDAVKACENRGGRLPEVKSEKATEDLGEIQVASRSGFVYLGAKRHSWIRADKQSSEFEWQDSKIKFTFPSWVDGRQDNSQNVEHCLIQYPKGQWWQWKKTKWNDIRCNRHKVVTTAVCQLCLDKTSELC